MYYIYILNNRIFSFHFISGLITVYIHCYFQLSNVEGGGVVFPNIGRVVYPEMGSVLFWLNTHDDGRLNEYSLHGVCPVLFGIRTSKLISKKNYLFTIAYKPNVFNWHVN